MFRTLVFAAAIAMVLACHAESWAQVSSSRSMFSSGGSIGQGISSSRMGSSSMGGMGSMGMGGMGMGGMGSSGLGSSSTGTLQLGSSAQQMLQSANQAGHFVGASAQNTVSSAYGTATNGRTSYGTTGYGQGAYGNRNRTNRARQYGQYGMSNVANQSLVPTRLVLGFDQQSTASAPQLSSQLTVRLQKVSRIQFRSSPQVLVENGTAILRGTVATEHDRALAEQLVRLEAGISQVRNELTLPSEPASSSSAAPEKSSSAPRPPQVPPSAPAAK